MITALSNKLFSRNPTSDIRIGWLPQQPRTGTASRCGRSLCSVQRRGAVIYLATIAALPLSWKVTERENISRANPAAKDTDNCFGRMTEEELFKKLVKAKEKTAKIHVYVQDALGGPNQTVWEVARSVQTTNSTTDFGQVRVLDDVVTAGADRNSEKLGRAQGLITSSDLTESALTMNLTFYFTSGEYKGSSLCIGGRNPINNKDRELPIVGGTGVFRMVRGYSITSTHSFDPNTNHGVLDYTFYVAYPEQEEC